MPNKLFQVHLDVDEIRAIYAKYGMEAAEGIVKKIVTTLEAKIWKELDLKEVNPGKKLLVEG